MEENQETTVTLEMYATVMAALGAGLTLSRALAHADVDVLTWEQASEVWPARIDDSAASDLALLVAFDAALLTARRRFEPTVEPIASDALAWTAFRRHFVTAVDPVAFLGGHELSLGAYARLEAEWANRALADDALAKQMQEYLNAPLDACPTLTRTQSPLLAPEPAPQPRALPPAELGTVLPPAPPPDPERPRRMPSAFADTSMVFIFPNAPVLPFASGAEPTEPAVREKATPTSKRPPAALSGTTMDLVVPKGPALPFAASTAPPEEGPARSPVLHAATEEPAPTAPAAGVKRPPAALASTSMGFVVPKGPALPFASSALTGPSEGGTVEVPVQPLEGAAGPALPFAPRADVPGPGTTPRDREAPESDVSAPMLTLQQYASLCAELAVFQDRSEAIFHRYGLGKVSDRLAADLSWQERLRRNPDEHDGWQRLYLRWVEHFEQMKAPRSDVGSAAPMPATKLGTSARPPRTGTASYQGIPLASVLPFVAAVATLELPLLNPDAQELGPATEAATPVASEAPSVGGTPGHDVRTALPSSNELSLTQYAAFCAELGVFPDHAAETFARYGVPSAREGVTLASAWQARFRKSPADFKEWHQLYQEFVEAFRTRGRPGGPL